MNTKILLYTLLSFSFTHFSFAQTNEQNLPVCDCEECHQFDFWIGEWKAEWLNKDGTISEGINIVKPILDGCVIEENFNGNPGMDFRGKSLSVYNHQHKVWQQTWVDTQGSYMLFTGGIEDDKMILLRAVATTEGLLTQRMVFYNIQKESFDWNWESSADGGENWKLNWMIRYTRIEY